MNNLRLLTGALSMLLSAGGVSLYSQSVLSLEEIFDAAEANSVQLRPYMTAVSEADREISVARAGRLPDINASLAFSFIGDGFTTKRDFSDYQKAPIPHFGNGMSVSVSQPIYTGGAISAAIDMAELKSTAVRYAADFRRDNIRFRLTGLYLDIYKYANLRKVVESNILAAREVLREMNARYEQGTALRNDITRYELLLSNLELQLIKINNTMEILNTNLVVTAGLPEGSVVLPDTTILQRALPTRDAGWWQNEAEANAPAISLARTGVEMSRKGEALAKSEMLPKIGLVANWTLDGPVLVEVPPINRNLSYWYVGVGLNYNLSSLYKSNKSLAARREASMKAAQELEATRQNIALEVNADYVKYLEAYEELKTQTKSVELAERNYNTTATRYSADMAIITDMLDAANSRLDAEQRLVNARIDIIYYYYKLLFTTGNI